MIQEKKAVAQKKAQLVLRLRQEHRFPALLKAAGLAKSTFFYRLKNIEVEDTHAGLKIQIRSTYGHHRGCYGYRRVTAQNRRDGNAISHTKAQRLMQVMGLRSVIRPKKISPLSGRIPRRGAQCPAAPIQREPA